MENTDRDMFYGIVSTLLLKWLKAVENLEFEVLDRIRATVYITDTQI